MTSYLPQIFLQFGFVNYLLLFTLLYLTCLVFYKLYILNKVKNLHPLIIEQISKKNNLVNLAEQVKREDISFILGAKIFISTVNNIFVKNDIKDVSNRESVKEMTDFEKDKIQTNFLQKISKHNEQISLIMHVSLVVGLITTLFSLFKILNLNILSVAGFEVVKNSMFLAISSSIIASLCFLVGSLYQKYFDYIASKTINDVEVIYNKIFITVKELELEESQKISSLYNINRAKFGAKGA